MTNNLNAPQMTGLQSTPEVTHNDGLGVHDGAVTEYLTLNSTGNITLTQAQYTQHMLFNVGTSGSSDTITLPSVSGTPIKRALTVWQNTSTHAVSLVVGSTSISLAVNAIALVGTDGTTNGLTVLVVGATGGQPYDLNVFISGVMSNNQEVFRHNAVRPYTLPSGLTGSIFTAGVAATASTTLTIKKNGSSIGTLVWAISGTVPTVTFASPVSFAVTDVLTIEGPATADTTLANIALNFMGTR